MRRKLIFLSLSIVLAISNNLHAQSGILATTNDIAAHPRTLSPTCDLSGIPSPLNVVNTGYDVFQINGTPVQTIQVMVWDGPNGALSWDRNGARGSILANTFPAGFTNMTDMDVVVHDLGSSSPQLSIIVVGVITDPTPPIFGRIGWVRFSPAMGGFFPTASGILGHNNRCSKPNIDTNNNGLIGICWSESADSVISYTITPDFIPPGSPYSTTVTRSDVYAAYGWINGAGLYGTPTIRGVSDPAGDKINLTTAPFLSERNENPDIAIRDHDATITVNTLTNKAPAFICWSNTYWDLVNFELRRRVNVFETETQTQHNLNSLNYAGSPRIAARRLDLSNPSANYEDYQIVFAAIERSCTSGLITGSKILNWGRNLGLPINVTPVDITALSSPIMGRTTTVNGGININPVVTYHFGVDNGNYIVSWEHQRMTTTTPGLTNGSSRDIVATTLNNGALASGVLVGSPVSFVNRRCGSITGNQFIPSIAGRYGVNNNGYCFWDNTSTTNSYIAYKTSTATPGITPGGSLRPQSEVDTTNPTDVILSPNPTKSTLDVKLTDKNNIEKINIYTSSGQLVLQKEAVKSNFDNIDVSKLSNGIYIISVETLSGETLTKEFIKE